MRLNNLTTISGEQNVDILIEKERIYAVSEHDDSSAGISGAPVLKFSNAIVFPGLINSHDHLSFNSFPQLGNRIYNNYVEWGDDIHKQNKDTINEVLKIPEQLRIQWGIYKNLLNGITTVVNHGPALSKIEDSLINIFQQSHAIHSIQLDKKWKYRLNLPFIKNLPIAIHIGEGTDKSAQDEISTLIKWNLFKRALIGIHAVAMNEEQAANFKAIVWCPDSNYFLLGRTAEIDKLKHQAKILFGTDSTVSSQWNLWDHLRLAKQQNRMTDNELLDTISKTPADVWPMPGIGSITKNYFADIVIGEVKSDSKGMDAFFSLNPENILMVIHKGAIRLFDEGLYNQVSTSGMSVHNFYKVFVNGRCKYIFGNLPELIRSIKAYYPEARIPVKY